MLYTESAALNWLWLVLSNRTFQRRELCASVRQTFSFEVFFYSDRAIAEDPLSNRKSVGKC